MRRWLIRAAIAASVVLAGVYVYLPRDFVAGQFEIRPYRMCGEILAIFGIAFVLVALADTIALWASRRPRTLRRSGVVSFITGLVCALFAISLWFAFLSVFVAPVGIAAAAIALKRETTNGEGHSLLNLTGLSLNLVALGILVSQVVSATVWR